MLPPWPKEYQLPATIVKSMTVWSPDGSRLAYTRYRPEDIIVDVITIVDQRHGLIHCINNMYGRGMRISDLKFSPDGSFLVSASHDGIIQFWDNVAENYEQLQEWNMREDFGGHWLHYRIDISACSKYIAVAGSSHAFDRVVIKNVENGRKAVKSLAPQPVMQYTSKVMFSVDYRVVFICGLVGNSSVIKLWRSYLENTDEDSLVTLWEQEHCNKKATVFSHDKTMIAIHDKSLNKGWLVSIDINYSCTVQKFNFEGNEVPVLLQFTPDDEWIIFATKNGLFYWSVAERKFTDQKYVVYNQKTMNNLRVKNCSPNNHQLIAKKVAQPGDSALVKGRVPAMYLLSISELFAT